MQYFYITVAKLNSEYACTVWNCSLTFAVSEQLESYQKEIADYLT